MSTTTVIGGLLFFRVKDADGQTRTLPAATHVANLHAELAQAERAQMDARRRLRDALMARREDCRIERQAVIDAETTRCAVLREIEAAEDAITRAQHIQVQAEAAKLIESTRTALAETLKSFDLTRFA